MATMEEYLLKQLLKEIAKKFRRIADRRRSRRDSGGKKTAFHVKRRRRPHGIQKAKKS